MKSTCFFAGPFVGTNEMDIKSKMDMLFHEMEMLKNECNCRIEHGAPGNSHLKYIEKRLRDLINLFDN